MEQYEQALETLGEFASEGNDNPRVIEAMGIATLRMPMLPIETPPDRREMILMAGRASYMMATRNTRGRRARLRGAGLALSGDAERPLRLRRLPAAGEGREGDRGVQARARDPAGPPVVADADCVRVPEAGRRRRPRCRWAKQAVAAAPNAFPARKALGQALLDTGDVDGAIRELQTGLKMAPDSPGLHFSSRARTSAPAGSRTPRASARSSRGSIAWRARSAAAHSRWVDI